MRQQRGLKVYREEYSSSKYYTPLCERDIPLLKRDIWERVFGRKGGHFWGIYRLSFLGSQVNSHGQEGNLDT